MKYIDVNAWLGSWPFRALRDNTPDTLIRRLDRAGIGNAAVSRIEAILHRSVQPANERLAEDLEGFTDRLIRWRRSTRPIRTGKATCAAVTKTWA